MITRSVPSSTESPLLTLISATFPSLLALMLFSIFIASRMMIVWPLFTVSPSFTFMSRITPGSGDLHTVFFGSCRLFGYYRSTCFRFRSGCRTGYRFRSGFDGLVQLYFIRGSVHFNVGYVIFYIVHKRCKGCR